MSTEQDAFIGRMLGGYQVQSRLGEGGMATVYKAHDPRLRRDVAIKVIHPQITERASFQARFEREAQMVANLTHPNIVSIYGIGDEGETTYLVMQYVSGGTLRDQLRGKRPLDPRRATHYAIQMAQALHYAHQRGIVHRDVKPQNMLVDGSDPKHLLLSDFGIAKIYGGGEDSVMAEMPTRMVSGDSSLTSVDQIIGTADYMAPEQAQGRPVDARTDVYALGVVLYQMLTGTVPFQADSVRGLLFQHVYKEPPTVRERNPQVPEILERITLHALAKDPNARFQSAEALAQALEQANANATNSMASSGNTTLVPPRPGSSFGPSNQAFPPLATTGYPPFNTVTQQESRPDTFGTMDDSRTITSARSLGGQNFTYPGERHTSGHYTRLPEKPANRRFPLSYFLIALVVLVGLIIGVTRLLPTTTGTSTGNSSTAAQTFTEDFHDNSRGWQVGSSLSNGVQADIQNNTYTILTSQNYTSFAYPQNAGSLPQNFTLSATMKEMSNPALYYGLAWHFTQIDASHVTGYALLMNSNGNYEIDKYSSAGITHLWQSSYSSTASPHTLQVVARGTNYALSVDGQSIKTGLDSSSLSDATYPNGSLALVVTGPQTGAGGHFVVSNVKLTLP